MRVLVAISILAFVALLWASIAIFRHIRRASRRRRRALESSPGGRSPIAPDRIVIAPPSASPVVPEITFQDPEAPIAEATHTYTEPGIREPTPVAIQPSPHIELAEPEPEPIPAGFRKTFAPPPPTPPVPREPREPALSPLPPWPHFGFTPARPTDTASSPIPYAAPPVTESSASVTPARVPLEIQPPPPAVKPLYPSVNPSLQEAAPPPRPLPPRAGKLPLRRVDLSFYNKDMGDLSDPAPAHSRPKIRSNNSD